MRIRGAIFDVDGTLLDSMFIWDTIGESYLRSIGYEPKENLNEAFKSMSLYQAACYYQSHYDVTLTTGAIMDGVNALLERYYRYEVLLKPGAAELAAGLQAEGVRLCIATATDRHLVEAALSRLGILPYFSSIFTCTEVGHGKDEPHIFEEALRFLGTKKEETLVLDDAFYAVQTAKKAGFPVAAVYDPYEKDQEGLRRLADLYLEDLSQLRRKAAAEQEAER
ncbi:MAG: HAD family phosphatase [Provencibacterium sp.]|nr:HAD family phosphatase [Provencibacterium sp.]